MILFSNDKEIIFKITNAVLLIWLVGAIVFFASSVINLTVQTPRYAYDEYTSMNCSYMSSDTKMTSAEKKQSCLDSYNSYKYSNKQENYYKQIALYTSLANIVIVGGVMYFLNKKGNKKIIPVISKSTKKGKK